MSDSPTTTIAFVVALVALVISLFQVIQQYIGSFSLRSKVGPAAIGAWSKATRRRLDIRQFKVKEEYLEPRLTWMSVCRALEELHSKPGELTKSLRTKYSVGVASSVAVRAHGSDYDRRPCLHITRLGDEAQTEVPPTELSLVDRMAVRKHDKFVADLEEAREITCTATWCNMMVSLVGDPYCLAQSIGKNSEFSDEKLHAIAALLAGNAFPSLTPKSGVTPIPVPQLSSFSGSRELATNASPRLSCNSDAIPMVSSTPNNGTHAHEVRTVAQRTSEDPSRELAITVSPRLSCNSDAIPMVPSSPNDTRVPKLRTVARRTADRPLPRRYLNADTISSSLDNPTMHIRFSDLISCGLALGMEIRSIDLHRSSIHMVGQYCSLLSQEEPGLGVIVRYSSTPGHIHPIQTCTPREVDTLVEFARGFLLVGDFISHMRDWGYNSVDALFEVSISGAQDDDWYQMSVRQQFFSKCEGDTDPQWGGRWLNPATPHIGFVFSICGNPAVANSFPLSLLTNWNVLERRAACARSYHILNEEIGFAQAPRDFLRNLRTNAIIMDDYKLANNWGAERGGIRGWASNLGTEFVKRVSEVWRVDQQSEQVPILYELQKHLEDGSVNREWAQSLGENSSEQVWKPTAETLLWLQCSLLDSWIARQVDLLILGTTDEASLPVDFETAKRLAERHARDGADPNRKRKAKILTTGWKRSRAIFIRLYLARLADGILAADGTRLGVSCMSAGGGFGAEGWRDMQMAHSSSNTQNALGNIDPAPEPEEAKIQHKWAAIDAALSLRAVLIATRFGLLNNTSVFLDLWRFDPTIRMA
ncbi:hypothetical protein DFH08DRAFT_939031 [Mycena albidolilacea]|uniref:Uncharacterized protein n=1 Tax=Mycena albidolilacea TaxID=1033008 RepID=A0AAD6ZT75_9AGAR|nr:hypothetical protein DFH08DRAFT_939031 [Mycena albidolilacea]